MWKDIKLHWEVIVGIDQFRGGYVNLDLHLENRQTEADKVRTLFVSQCANSGVDLSASGGLIGTGHSILTHQVGYDGGGFSGEVGNVVGTIRVFDSAKK